MNLNRRHLATTTALALPVAALAACSTVNGLVTNGTLQNLLNQVQAAMPAIELIAQGVSVFVPGSASMIAVVEQGLSAAYTVAQTIVATMTTAAAQPLVQQIFTNLKAAIDAISQALAGVSNPAVAKWGQFLAEASQVVQLIGSFVVPAVGAKALAPQSIPHMYVLTH